MSDAPEIPCPDMPPDGAARYRVMVAEKRRVEADAAAERGKRLVAEAEVAVLRRLLGLHAPAPTVKQGTMG